MTDAPTTFCTGNTLGGSFKRWAKIGSTKHYGIFCMLRWSEDITNEQGVMYMTEKTERVKLNKHGVYAKNPFGVFRTVNDKITIKAMSTPTPRTKPIDTNNQHKDIYSRKPNTLDRFTSAFAKIAFKGDNDLIRKAAEQLEGLLKP